MNQFGQTKPSRLLQDNLGTASWTEEAQGLRNVKHAQIQFNSGHKAFEQTAAVVKHSPSAKNLADFLPKVLVAEQFEIHQSWLDVHDIE